MLIYGALLGALDATLTIAASMAHRDPFVLPMDRKQAADAAKRALAAGIAYPHPPHPP